MASGGQAAAATGREAVRPRRDGQPWTHSERQSLRRAAADFTLLWADIGELLGRTGHACRVEAAKEGWVPRSNLRQKIEGAAPAPVKIVNSYQSGAVMRIWTADDMDALRADWANPDLDRADVAAKHGRTDQAVAHKAYKLRLGRKARHVARPTPKAAEPAKLSADYVAELLRRGISQQTIDMMGRK